jgi:glycerol uptake facilitator-like aquaporin
LNGLSLPKLLIQGIAECIGTALLVCVVVASGIMGTNLSNDSGVALLINALSTVLALALLIFVLAPISGAHFNPVVSLVQLLGKKMTFRSFITFTVFQTCGAFLGAMVANLMFNQPAISIAEHQRVSSGTLVGEVLATAGLIIVIETFSNRAASALIPIAVGAWIGSAYAFTSSTAFANPAVTFGRIFSNSFAGIAPGSVIPFILAQLLGAIIGLASARALARVSASEPA